MAPKVAPQSQAPYRASERASMSAGFSDDLRQRVDQGAGAFLGHQGDDGRSVGRVQRLDGVGDGVESAGDGHAHRAGSGSVRGRR